MVGVLRCSNGHRMERGRQAKKARSLGYLRYHCNKCRDYRYVEVGWMLDGPTFNQT